VIDFCHSEIENNNGIKKPLLNREVDCIYLRKADLILPYSRVGWSTVSLGSVAGWINEPNLSPSLSI